MPDLTPLKRKRGAVRAKLTIFSKFLEPIYTKFNENLPIEEKLLVELQNKFADVEQLQAEFDEVQLQIELEVPEEELDAQYLERETFTNSYSHLVSAAQIILKKLADSDLSADENDDARSSRSVRSASVRATNADRISLNHFDVGNETNNFSLSKLKLPTISLPRFQGDYNHWLEFKDTFSSLIHTNASLHNIQKFHYLRASLEGDALEFSAENYMTAWDLLKNRYDNSRLLVHNHIKALFSLEKINQESSTSLRNLLDSVFKHLRALKTLEQPTEHWDSLIIFVITSKLDKVTASEWEKRKINNKFPTLDELKEFLKLRADVLETIELSHSNNDNYDKITKHVSKPRSSHSLLTSSTPKCNFCKEPHLIYTCEKFLALATQERINKARELHLCLNCLCTGHTIKGCKSRGCKTCHRRHNSLLHLDQTIQSNSPAPSNSNANSVASTSAQPQVTINGYVSSKAEQVLLSTVSIYCIDSNGKKQSCRSLLDNGSQSNFLTLDFCSKLNLAQHPANIQVVGINKATSNLQSKCNVTIMSRTSDFSATISCLLVPVIANNVPDQSFDRKCLKLPDGILLADPLLNKTSNVDLLIGAGLFWDLLLNGRIQLENAMLQNSVFGYILTGAINIPFNRSYCNMNKITELQGMLEPFWKIEKVCDQNLVSQDDEVCESHFRKTTTRELNGRFNVRLPLKYETANLGDSKQFAIKRFLQLEAKFRSNPVLKRQYTDFINEYRLLDHMTKISDNESIANSYFLPHHAVLRSESLTTKLRVVFDGSARSSSGWSLNDLQYKGPAIQNDIFDILVRFRQHPVVVTSDIEKMYRQINIEISDQHLQQIVWRDDPYSNFEIYRLGTVTYGTKSAPFLALRCIKQLAIENKSEFPVAASIIESDFYVDDLITGFASEEEAIETCREISNILKGACFNLRKWNTNVRSLLPQLTNSNDTASILNLGDTTPSKTLGIKWESATDELLFQPKFGDSAVISKRTILSDIAKIYDPLGLTSPSILKAKILIQNLWATKTEWDDPLPQEITEQWLQLKISFQDFSHLRIPRFTLCKNFQSIQLHGFCDASKQAYAACIYLRSTDSDDNVSVNILCAKTKVAPIKEQTIPRLELCSAVLLIKLTENVLRALNIQLTCFLWSDSQIFLHWLRTDPSRLQIFVGNRIKLIQDKINQIKNSGRSNTVKWDYVNTKFNPADVASRGIMPSNLVEAEIWWHGAPWLLLPENQWPKSNFNLSSNEVLELKEQPLKVFTNLQDNFTIFNDISSLKILKRVIAYCLRFIFNCKSKIMDRKCDEITPKELDDSLKLLVRLAQATDFHSEIKALSANNSLTSKCRINSLCPFLDSEGLLRVGGRISKSQALSYKAKHPYLLDSNHPLSKLIFEHEHDRLFHAGPQLLLATVRQQFWILKGINAAKRCVRNCVMF